MSKRLVLCLALILLLTACGDKKKPKMLASCDFVIASGVNGVMITASNGASKITAAGSRQVFPLSCQPQTFRFSKPCYPDRAATLPAKSATAFRLQKNDWDSYGYLRVENDSRHDGVEIAAPAGEVLNVASGTHAVSRLALGDYAVEVRAPFKVPVEHQFRLCEADQIHKLRVSTNGHDGELTSEGVKEITLDHGIGSLLVVTELPNVIFEIAPDRSELIDQYLREAGLKELSEVVLAEAPEALRKSIELLQKLGSDGFRAPNEITLPAGQYRLKHNRQPGESEWLGVQVLPGRETRLEVN